MEFFNILVAGLLLGGIYALVSVGLNLIFGVTRVVNFAQGEFVMLGMYAAYFGHTVFDVSPYLSVLAIAPLAFLLGVCVQRAFIQRIIDRPMMQLFVTFGLVILLQNAVLMLTNGQAKTVNTEFARTSVSPVNGIQVSMPRFVVFVVATALTVAIMVFLRRTFIGMAIRAVSQDRRAARLVGVNVERTYLLTFGLGVALAGIAGALLAPLYTLSPSIGFSFILPAFAVVILGGLGSVPGAYIGGLLVGIIETLAGYYIDPSLKQAVWFMLFVGVLAIRPQGLMGQAGSEEMGMA